MVASIPRRHSNGVVQVHTLQNALAYRSTKGFGVLRCLRGTLAVGVVAPKKDLMAAEGATTLQAQFVQQGLAVSEPASALPYRLSGLPVLEAVPALISKSVLALHGFQQVCQDALKYRGLRPCRILRQVVTASLVLFLAHPSY